MAILTASFGGALTVASVSTTQRTLPIYSVETSKKEVALTFDCAWGADDIGEIVNVLNENEISATFFVVGDWADKYPEAIKLLKKKLIV